MDLSKHTDSKNTSARGRTRDCGRDCGTLSEGLLDVTPNAHEGVLRCVRRRRDCRVGVDGRGDGAADGVAGGRAWGSRTLSLQQGKLVLVHSVQRL